MNIHFIYGTRPSNELQKLQYMKGYHQISYHIEIKKEDHTKMQNNISQFIGRCQGRHLLQKLRISTRKITLNWAMMMDIFQVADKEGTIYSLRWRHDGRDRVSITSLTVVYSTIYSDADQRKHQSSASLAFVWGIHRDRWIPRTYGPQRGKCFHLMTSSCTSCGLYVISLRRPSQ